MPFRASIRIPDLQGDDIEVESFYWGVAQLGGPGGAVKPSVQDFSFVKRVDGSSPLLFTRCFLAEPLGEAVFVVLRPDTPEELVRYTFSDVRVASVRPGGSARGAEDLPLEEVTLGFTRCALDVGPSHGECDTGRAR